jgi:hypothetical protein
MDNGINTKGLYIYGIIPVYYEADQFRELDKLNVFNVPYRKISAIVSRNSVIDYRQLGIEPLAKLLVDHQKTIEQIMHMGFTTILPMRLGTFANNTAEVIRILEKGYDLIIETLERISNLVEVDLVSTWCDFNQVLAEIAVNPQVTEVKEKIQKSRKAVTQSDQLSVGYLVKKIIDEKRSEVALEIIGGLKPFSQDIRQNEILNDQMVSNLAFLLSQNQVTHFEEALDSLDGRLGGKMNFKLVGPLPCYSFFTLEVKKLLFDEIESAKTELGLNSAASEKIIKDAYLEKVKCCHPDMNPGDESTANFNRINKAFQTMLNYTKAVKPATSDDYFSLSIEAVNENSVFLKIKD